MSVSCLWASSTEAQCFYQKPGYEGIKRWMRNSRMEAMAPLSNLRSDIQSLHHASFKRTELKDPAHIQGEEIAQRPENQRQRSVCVCVYLCACTHMHALTLPYFTGEEQCFFYRILHTEWSL